MSWRQTRLTQRLSLDVPIFGAPLGGGPSTPSLAAAVSNAGGLGSLAGGYLTPEQIAKEIETTRAMTQRPFAVNLFALADPPPPDPARLEATNRRLDAYRGELALPPGTIPSRYAEVLDEQFAVMLAKKPAVFSFTFGIPPQRMIDACRTAGIFTMGTATNEDEARVIEDAGIDAVCAQGAEAGGHRGTFIGVREAGLIGTIALVPRVLAAVHIPVIASGGIVNGSGIAAALALGADAVQLGTAFLRCPEAGTSAPYRAALRSDDSKLTAITRAFSGRDARGIENRLLRELAEFDPPAYPYHNALTRDIRAAAAKAGRAEFLSLWAGQAAPLAEELPAGELMKRLIEETETAVARLCG